MQYMARETMAVRVDPQVRDELDAIAAAVNRDRSYVVTEALNAYIETHRWQVGHIKKGLRQADAGRFASKRQVHEVLKRLRNR